LGQAPLALGVQIFGWRLTLSLIAILFLLLCFLITLFVKDYPVSHEPTVQVMPASNLHLWHNFITVIRNPQSWLNGIYAGFLYAPTAAIGELWGVSFLTQTYTLTAAQAAVGTTFIFIGWGIGGPLAGWLSDYYGRRRGVMMGSALLSLVFLSYIIYFPNQSFVITTIALFLYGVSNAGVGVAYALASELNPRRMAGTSMAFANMCSIVVGAFFQPFIGKILDLQWDGVMADGVPLYNASQFRSAFLVLPLCMVVALIAGWKVKETFCRPQEDDKSKIN
jgi:MFS family permease